MPPVPARELTRATVLSDASINRETLSLALHIRAAEAAQWPGLALHVHAQLPRGRVPLDELHTAGGVMRHGNSAIDADPLDALLLRTIRQLPQDANGAYAAGAREFGRVLAL